MDRGAWWAAVQGRESDMTEAASHTTLSYLPSHMLGCSFLCLECNLCSCQPVKNLLFFKIPFWQNVFHGCSLALALCPDIDSLAVSWPALLRNLGYLLYLVTPHCLCFACLFPSRLWGSWAQGHIHCGCISFLYPQGLPHCQARSGHRVNTNTGAHSFCPWPLTCSRGRITTVLKSGHLSTRAFRLNGFPWFMWKTVP